MIQPPVCLAYTHTHTCIKAYKYAYTYSCLEMSTVCKIEKLGLAFGQNSSFFLGANPTHPKVSGQSCDSVVMKPGAHGLSL